MSEVKKIIIVGGTSGIGREMAEIYAINGNMVGITGRRKELLEEIANNFPANIIIECFDVTGNNNIEHLEAMVNKLGGLDILVYSSGIGEPSKTLEWSLNKKTIDTNVYAFTEISDWAFNYFIKQGHGSLVTISSVASHRGNSWAPAYSASKAFQSNYFEGLSIKAFKMKKAIDIICIEPGYVDTPMAKGNKLFWIVPLKKAAVQIVSVIERKQRKAYISKRWALVGFLLKLTPFWLYKKFG